jgi:thiol-disulfide isomerase/thioredoxin
MAMEFGRLQRALVGPWALLAVACSPKPNVNATWAMPAPRHLSPGTLGADPSAAGAVAGEQSRGDLPETAYPRDDDLWRSDERRAVSEARDSSVGMVIDFWADWCDACWRFEKETFGDPAVRGLISSRFVPLRIDVTEDSFLNREQLQRYSVTSLPTVLLLDANGREVERIDKFMESQAFLARLEAARQKRVQ